MDFNFKALLFLIKLNKFAIHSVSTAEVFSKKYQHRNNDKIENLKGY